MGKQEVERKLKYQILADKTALELLKRIPDGLSVTEALGCIYVHAKRDADREAARQALLAAKFEQMIDEDLDTFTHPEIECTGFLLGTVILL